MDIFLLRHGEAEREAAFDAERALTVRGEKDLHDILGRCQPDLRNITYLLVSPYLRTRQTAQIAQRYLSRGIKDSVSERLVPEADPDKLIASLQELKDDSIMLVSHQPLIGTFLDRLCGFEPGRYRMGTSALAAIRTEVVAADLGELLWLRQPGD